VDQYLVPILLVVLVWQWGSQGRANSQMEKRLRDLEVRFEKLQRHIGFVADPNPPTTADVMILARTPGSKIAAIKAYREQTGAGLKEAKDAVERMERS
jgi:ribosomal protein L7/L12